MSHLNIVYIILYSFVVGGQPLGMYMMDNHRPSCHVTAPVKFHMSDSPAACKLKATVSNMVKCESTERPTMEEVKVAVDCARGKLIVSEKKIITSLLRGHYKWMGVHLTLLMPNVSICIFRCINLLSLN